MKSYAVVARCYSLTSARLRWSNVQKLSLCQVAYHAPATLSATDSISFKMRISIFVSLALLASVAVSKPMPKKPLNNPFTHDKKPSTTEPGIPPEGNGTTTTANAAPSTSTTASDITTPSASTTASDSTTPSTSSTASDSTTASTSTTASDITTPSTSTAASNITTFSPITLVATITTVSPIITVSPVVTVTPFTTVTPITTLTPVITVVNITTESTLTTVSPITTVAPVITNTPVTIVSTITTVFAPTTTASDSTTNTLPPVETPENNPDRSNNTTKRSTRDSVGDDDDFSCDTLPLERVVAQGPSSKTYKFTSRDTAREQIGQEQVKGDLSAIQTKLDQVNLALQHVSCARLEEGLRFIAQQVQEAEIIMADAQNLLLLPPDL
ncbi:hypothetical protein EDD36DRAFT_223801 [Exophiala viscosa]|uniref:Uncharacterized protein n=1 Tax=Exophiala viscosa TaxID=2486360 RepID=A0AAN6DZQ1_9EURO|nr:hypothetical protein EDD36DRAFT_223801 [Exophiala viscosa]